MRPEWRRYWKETIRHLIYIPAGLLISFIPFLFTIREYRQQGILLDKFISQLTFGLTISAVITLFFLVAFALFTIIFIKTKIQLWNFFTLQIAIAIFATVIGVWSALFLRAWMAGEKMERGAFFSALAVGLFMAIMFLLHSAYQSARRDTLALKVVVAEARYNALEQQLRPHFLFNALNSLAELIESGQENSAKMTHTLADLYRQILTNSGMKTALLKSEIDIARRYLEIEKIRFGKRLKFSFNLPADAENIFLPSLVVQTLVENAVKHGIAKSVGGGEVIIDLARPKGRLYQLRVINTGKPYSDNGSSGTGLANTRARLDLLYGKLHQFNLATDESGRTVASFSFTGEKID
jgi:two-component system, LytTR family, sensor kinase